MIFAKLEGYYGMPIYTPCPKCNKKTYRRYTLFKKVVDTGGKCDSIKGCGYSQEPERKPDVISSIAGDLFSSSIHECYYEKNNLFHYLKRQFGKEVATDAMKLYSIGTAKSKSFPGGAVLWQIDEKQIVRTGRIVCFNPETCSEPDTGKGHNGAVWVHRRLKDGLHYRECLYGQHLLTNEPTKAAVIVPTELAAIVGSCRYPEYLWLAVGWGMHGLGADDKLLLGEREVICEPKTWKSY